MANSSLETKGFFSALFDFSFTSFITMRFLKVIYGILIVLAVLGGLMFLFGGLAARGATAVVFVILAPLVTLLYIVLIRIYMELIALFFRIAENTSAIAATIGGQSPAVGDPAYGGPASGDPSSGGPAYGSGGSTSGDYGSPS